MQAMKTITLLFTLLISPAALAADWTTANLRSIDQFIIPAQQEFFDAGNALKSKTAAFCAAPDEQQLKSVRLGYHRVMDAWQRVQLLRQGPAEFFMRHFRVQTWPDRNNTGARQLRKLIADENREVLEAEAFAATSIAVQGLSAMERLLFSTDVTYRSFIDNGQANYSCALLLAISNNIETITSGLLEQWRGEYREAVAAPSADNDYFESSEEVAALFLKQLNTQLQAVSERKLKRPLDGKRFRPKRAESWRSSRSLKNILLNLEAAQQLYLLQFAAAVTDGESKQQLAEQFKLVISLGEQLQMPLKKAYEEHPQELQRWQQELDKLQRMIATKLPPAVNLPLGFNSLDGD